MAVSSRSNRLRVTGFVMIAVGVLVAVLQLVAIANPELSGLAEPLAWLAVLAGIGFVLLASHAVLTRPAAPDEYEALASLSNRLDDLARALGALEAKHPPPVGQSASSIGKPVVSAAGGEVADLRGQMARLTRLVEEVRDFAMLSEDQKQTVMRRNLQQRKQETLGEIHRGISEQRWADVERLLKSLEEQFPGEMEIKHTRWEFEHARQNAQEDTFRAVRGRVEDSMSVSSWDQAMATSEEYVANYPADPAGKQLLERVIRERDVAVESIAGRMHEEIVAEVERRHWRRALAAARRLVERFPDHPRTRKIMEQITVIQDNAQIEERQEQEMRIQELIRGKRFNEAIELGEELIERFPTSPQAESLRELLPRIKELVTQQVEDSLS